MILVSLFCSVGECMGRAQSGLNLSKRLGGVPCAWQAESEIPRDSCHRPMTVR